MPYRRLPNTDKARLAALEKAVAMEHECDVEHAGAAKYMISAGLVWKIP